jgi:Class III cytochrome C family
LRLVSQIFRPYADTVARAVLVAILVGPFLLIGLGYAVTRSPYTTNQYVTLRQPIPFSHKHHVGDDGIDCRYCHTAVERSAFAGLPPTTTCMTCHSQLFANAPMLEPVRTSLAEHRPIERAMAIIAQRGNDAYAPIGSEGGGPPAASASSNGTSGAPR